MKDTRVSNEMNPISQTRKGPEDRTVTQGHKTRKVKIIPDSSDEDELFSVHVQKRKKKKVRIDAPASDSEEEEEQVEPLPPPIARKVSELPYVSVPPLSYKDMSRKKDKGPRVDVPEPDKKPSYKVVAPLADPDQADAIIKKLLDTPINITAGEAMGVSRQLRDMLKKLLSSKRVALEDVEKVSSFLRADEENDDQVPLSRTIVGNTVHVEKMIHVDDLPAARYLVTQVATPTVPKGSLIVGDPVLQYLNGLAPGEKPKEIYVAKDSEALRCIYPVVNDEGEEESLLDGGSQIISMDKSVAVEMGVPWDPDIVINMQSANAQVEPTLGLARNVRFAFGEISLYLQVHIVSNAPYKILLGRPFDSLTESVVSNDKDGGQMLTITDPNTGKHIVLPTFARGQPRVLKQKQKDAESFYSSMS